MAFLITKDLITPENEDSYGVGVEGPRYAREEILVRLRNGEGEPFRLLDDDRNLYYEGLFIDDGEAEKWEIETEFQPLEAYGRPNAGAVIIEYKNSKNEWEAL
jgi:hypothetical protein